MADMTSSVEDAIDALRRRPPERAEELAPVVLDAAASEQSELSLSSEQAAVVRERLAAPLDIAGDDEVEVFFAAFGA